MKRLLMAIVVAMTMGVAAMAQTKASDITKIKKSKEYIYAEATEATEEAAINAAKAELDIQVEEYVVSTGMAKEAVAVVVKDIRQMTSKIAVMRGDMHRVFLYVKKKDITTSRSDVTVMNVENGMPEQKSKVEEVPIQPEPATQPEQMPVVEANPNAAGSFFTQITGKRADTLNKIAQATTLEAAEKILQEEKTLMNVKGHGNYANCRNITQSYWVVEANGTVTILSPERDGTRWNYKTGLTDSLGKYTGKLWFRL